MASVQKEFVLSATIQNLLVALIMVFGMSFPFMLDGMRGSDRGGLIGGVGGLISFVLLLKLITRLRLRWLMKRLNLRVFVEWSRDEKLVVNTMMKPMSSGSLELFAVELWKVSLERSKSGLNANPNKFKEKGLRALPLRAGEPSWFDSSFELPKDVPGFVVELCLQRPSRRPVLLRLYIENKPWRHLSSVKTIETEGLTADAPLQEVTPQLIEKESEPIHDPYREGGGNFQRVELSAFEPGENVTGSARLRGGLSSVGSFFYWAAAFTFAFFIAAREQGLDETYIGIGGAALGGFFLWFSRLHVRAVVFALSFGVFFLAESRLLSGVRSYSWDSVSSALVQAGAAFVLLALLHCFFWWRTSRK